MRTPRGTARAGLTSSLRRSARIRNLPSNQTTTPNPTNTTGNNVAVTTHNGQVAPSDTTTNNDTTIGAGNSEAVSVGATPGDGITTSVGYNAAATMNAFADNAIITSSGDNGTVSAYASADLQGSVLSSPLSSLGETPEREQVATARPVPLKRDIDQVDDDGHNRDYNHSLKRPRIPSTDTLSQSPSETQSTEEKQTLCETPNTKVAVDQSPLAPTNGDILNKPEIWACTRGGMCEALPYYGSYQGSLYTKKTIAEGVMLDKQTEERDIFTAQVIISTLGGGRKKCNETGKMIRENDASDNSIPLRAVRQAKDLGKAVAVIPGEENPLYPHMPAPRGYSVLDWFHITDVWKERVPGNSEDGIVSVWKVRFEKADLQKLSWWQPDGYYACATPDTVVPSATCIRCKEDSKIIFTLGWTCLNSECTQYYVPFKHADQETFEYTEEFLNQRNAFTGTLAPLRPDFDEYRNQDAHGTGPDARRGFVCPLCGCCSRKRYWDKHVCENKACGKEWDAKMHEYPRELLEEENEKFARATERARASSGDPLARKITREIMPVPDIFTFGGYTAYTYQLPDADGNTIGTFTLFRASEEVNREVNGPDEMFRDMTNAKVGLKRNIAALAGKKLEGLCRHFSQNFGARYKFGVDVQSKGFDEAPDVILKALHRLIWASKHAIEATAQVLADKPVTANTPPSTVGPSFNELLALGYMEADSIRFHDDGESELGPTVAALALGSPSVMQFRPKIKKSGFGERVAKVKGNDFYQTVLEVPMCHGDIMVMHGAHIHRIYEHAVQPSGGRRYSLTSRYIDPAKMTKQADRDDAAIKGKIPEESYAYTYNG